MRMAFDWDGTLVDHKVKPIYDDAAHVHAHTVPHKGGLLRARRLMAAGFELHIVTGRGPLVRDVTLNQIRAFLAAPGFPATQLHTQGHWEGYEKLRCFKAGVLRGLSPILYVGDHAADLGAASDAGVPFMDAESFRVGHRLPFGLREADVVA